MKKTMRAMILKHPKQRLTEVELAAPAPGPGEILVKIQACAVCRTDLHVMDGELPQPKLPLIPGHEIVGTVAETGPGTNRFSIGERVGVAWLGWSCGACRYCRSQRENLCDRAQFTGYTRDGGYADYATADERFCYRVPASYSSVEAAPLLCAGLIGYRSLLKAGDAKRLGIYGFGAAAHLITQVALFQKREVYVFTRPGDQKGQEFAAELGAVWAGDSNVSPPAPLDAAIIFAPAGELVPQALRSVAKGGTVVCGGIHMSDIPSFPYSILWEERSLRSVANLTRRDAEAFLELAPRIPIRARTETFPLTQANEATERLRQGAIEGAAVLVTEAGVRCETG